MPFLTMSCNCSRAQYFRPLQEAGNDIVFIDPISPAGGNSSIVSGMFGSQKVLARALEDAPAGHIGPFARSLRKQGYTWDSIHGQVLGALWLGHERDGTPQIHLETPIAMKERVLAKTFSPHGRRGRRKPGDRLLALLNSL